MILRPVLPRHDPHYEGGALLNSATEELKWCSREELRLPPLCIFCSAPHEYALSRTALHLEPRSSQNRMHDSYTSEAFRKNWCAMPVPPRRSLVGSQECCCYTNDAKT